jgi:opacity protein-like surface antigen
MKKLLIVLMFLAAPAVANAQVIVAKAPVTPSNPCTPTSCTGAYVGGFIAGNGTNADIVGSGLSGSVFAGGGIPGGVVGYQFANGTYFLAGEAGMGWQVNVGGSVNGLATNETGYLAYEGVKVGGQIAGLLGTQASTTIPTALVSRLISPYVIVGAVERPFANGWMTGAGATFDLSNTLFLDIGYKYINYGAATAGNLQFNSENLVTVGFNYKFNF